MSRDFVKVDCSACGRDIGQTLNAHYIPTMFCNPCIEACSEEKEYQDPKD